MLCLLVLFSFFATVTPLAAAKTGAQDTSSTRVSALTTPNLDKDAQIEALQSALSEATTNLKKLQESLTEAQKKQADILALNATLQSQIETHEKTTTESTTKISELEKTIEELQAEATSLPDDESVIAKLQSDLKAKHIELDALQKELVTARESLKHAESQQAIVAADKDKEYEAITKEREKLQEQVAALQTQLKDAETVKKRMTELETTSSLATKDERAAQDQIAELTETTQTLNRTKKELEDQLEELSSKFAELEAEHTELQQNYESQAESVKSQSVALDVEGRQVAFAQWNAFFKQIHANIYPLLLKLEKTSTQIPSLLKRTKEVASGRTVALEMNKKLRTENEILAKKLEQLAEFDAKFAELEKQKLALETSIKELTATSKEKDDQLSTLADQLKDVKAQLEHSKSAMEELQSTQVTPAAQLRAQLVALKQLMATMISQTQRQLGTIGEKMVPLADYINAAKDNEQKLKDLARTLKTLGDNVKELIDLAKQVSMQKRTYSGSEVTATPTAPSSDQIRRLEDQLASVTDQYNQLVRSANERVDMLHAQLLAERRKPDEGSSVKTDMERLQKQLDEERTRRETDARIAQQIKDATLTSKLDAQRDLLASRLDAQDGALMQSKLEAHEKALLQAQLDARRDRETDIATSTAMATAGQAFATGIAAATKTAAPSNVTLNLSDLQAGLARYGAAPTTQMINGMPSQYRPYMTSLAGLPQFKPPTSMGYLASTTGLIASKRTTYINTYNNAIKFLSNPAARNNIEAFNFLEAAVFSAASREGYLWFSRAVNSPNPSAARTEALNNLRMLTEQVALPLNRLKEQLKAQGISNYNQPEDLVAKFTGFRKQLGEAI